MNMRYLSHVCIVGITLWCILGTAGAGHPNSWVSYDQKRLTIKAENISLVKLLEHIARQTKISIFISEGFDPGVVSLDLKSVSLEKALNNIVKNQNVVTIYQKQGETFGITALHIYPQGQEQGQLRLILPEEDTRSGNRAVKGQTRQAGLGKQARIQGPFMKGRYMGAAAKKDDRLVHMAWAFEQREKKMFDEINELKGKISTPENLKNKNRLVLELLNKFILYEKMQRRHMDVMASLSRAVMFKVP